jgi:6-pyruvoyltetrahydropterin/6-carboxytetrahydropterin synthase
MEGILASTENLVIEIWNILKRPIQKAGGDLAKIKLIETENNFVEYYGGNEPY